ncbi:E3 ubiquitin-protein ligase RNF180 [Syngnathus typhle]|uniref:E3 ubiquitin-protein ligase RNF180 n=1 Tax=Syngnathus typhle TaxID=161592 RepID=UPI002A6B23C7|nr:E3 ubiquitin-protein ligase RNF180 [Syngnathus typhle]
MGLKGAAMNSHVGVSGGNESSIRVEQLLRPALPGRKVHSEIRRDGDERSWEKRGRLRKCVSIENVGNGSEEGGSTESLSSSGSDQVDSAVGSNAVASASAIMNKTSLQHPQAAGRCSPPPLTSVRNSSPVPSRPQRASSSGTTSVRPPSRPPRDPCRVDVRTPGGLSQTLNNAVGETHLDEEEEAGGVMDVTSPSRITVPERMSKKERKRIKCARRRQKRKERWRQSQLQGSTGSITSSSDEEEEDVSKEGYMCAVCLDVYFSPYMCQPCKHIFCEPCLRTLAKNCPTSTPCPLCRTIITHVFFQKELNQMVRMFFPKEYACRKQNFQKATCAKWPLPSCRKLFRIFGGFRPSSPMARRQLPRAGGGFRLSALDFDDDGRGWHFDMDMVIIYIYSVNWIIGFFIVCILCYLFFPSF